MQDTANVLGSLTGANQANPGPREYDATKLDNSYAACIQLSWMKPIPSGDPLSWPVDFNAQNIGGSTPVATPTPTPPVDPNQAFDVYAVMLWELSKELLPSIVTEDIPRNTGIFDVLWKPEINTPNFHGLVLSREVKKNDKNGNPAMFQLFQKGVAVWPLDGKTKAYWI